MSIKIALAGNPNCGKTTLFNALTGSNQFVGNWPGVTVEKKEGKLKNHKDVVITDLPGIYSLSPYTLEEVVARNYLINEKPDAIINIVDGTNIERNLYLSTQIMELGIPVIMAVNMMDVLEKTGDTINTDKLSQKLGCEVVEISALKGTGIQKAAEKAVALASDKKRVAPVHSFDKDVEAVITKVEEKLANVVTEEQKRFFAIKLLEKDDKIQTLLDIVPEVDDEIKELEDKFDDDTESIITNERYVYISSIIGDCLKKAKKKTLTTSDKIDRIVTNRWLALPIFAAIMFLVYYIAVSTVGTFVTDWTNDGLFGDGWHLFGNGSSAYEKAANDYAVENIWTDDVVETVKAADEAGVIGADNILGAIKDEDYATFEEEYGTYGESLTEAGYDISETVDEAMEDAPDTADYGIWVPGIPVLVEKGLDAVHCAGWLKGLILDGIVAGVGAVLGFVPQMLVLFILLAFLEACGYMARVAFIMDRIFRKFGLSGKSFIPMLIGSGCGVPGVMASRTIENDRDRKMTIMTTTFIPCGAKLPIIALIATALFQGAWWVAPSAYFVGIAAIICSGIILKKTKMFAGDPAPFVMELPAYHMPTVGNVLRSMWERGWSFIKKAGTIILLSSIIIWAGSSFGFEGGKFGFNPDIALESSILGKIGNAVSFIFAPLGFNNIKATIATIMGLVAKEEVVGVFGVLDFENMTKIAAYSFLVFNLLCAPCFAAMGAIKREMNNTKWFWFAIGYQTLLAYVVSLCIYQIGALIIGEISFGIATVVAILLIIGFLYLLFRPYKESKTLRFDSAKLNKK
ncbi:ferrous iron transporter B [Bovifimicola ammoniilytica]|uniref:ferrous iron transporter B n=1 Tax=Bovifimicola ammoniilytica TaxID=2981720 RepID=UPI000821810C|nr:ferrous iron transporter B [Bovifimicola ammoniilytica]MCU6752638.1 ferrous iron transporter B [Bovifimicola ammoniilytica]SCJ31646.1 Ferrous iron transport protein B [uncultured Eubacterium sp.]